MKFFVVIGRNALYTYEENGRQYDTQYIDGSAEFPVGSSSVGEDVASYLDRLANEKNLGTKAKLEFDVLESADKLRNNAVMGVLKEYAEKTYPLEETLRTVYRKLGRDKSLLVDRYGINYDGYSYKGTGDALVRGDFDLLALTVSSKDVVDMM